MNFACMHGICTDSVVRADWHRVSGHTCVNFDSGPIPEGIYTIEHMTAAAVRHSTLYRQARTNRSLRFISVSHSDKYNRRTGMQCAP